MNKKALFEHFKTVILAVLFVTTILLLHLCFTQGGQSFSITELLGGQNRVVKISVDDCLLPEYNLKSNGDGSYNLSFENKKEFNKEIFQCAKNLISSSTAKLVEIDKKEYDSAARKENSMQSIFAYPVAFSELSNKLISRKIEAPEDCKFNAIMFSDGNKECFFLNDFSGKYYKVVSGENYYAIDKLLLVYEPGNDVLKESYGIYDIEKIKSDFAVQESYPEFAVDNETIAKNIFGDNFDFVRKISDSFGNETYMYGYGQKRLSFFVEDGGLEFKEDVSRNPSSDFYKDLELALSFIANAFNLEDIKMNLVKAELIGNGPNVHYEFTMDVNGCRFVSEVAGSKVCYLAKKTNN